MQLPTIHINFLHPSFISIYSYNHLNNCVTFVKFANKLEKKDHNLWVKFKDFIKSFLDKIDEWLKSYEGVKAEDDAGRAIQNAAKNTRDQIRELYIEAFVGAEENFKASATETKSTADGGVKKYSNGGRNAKTADVTNLSVAEKMLLDGLDSETIRKATGWFKGYDGKWRFEIDDSKMEFVKSDVDYFKKTHSTLLGYLIKHNELFSAYPELKNVYVQAKDTNRSGDAWYSPKKNTITIDVSRLDNLNTTDNKKLLIHEIQHAIQTIENFTSGTDTKDFVRYLKTAGEIEAYDVGDRLGMTAEQRKNTRPDIDSTDVVFAEGNGTSMSIIELEGGKKYVKANVKVIKGDDSQQWAKQVSKYINEELRKWGDFSITADNGDVLTLTKDTAYKAGTRNKVRNPDGTYRSMTDTEYNTKLLAEVHINELSEISVPRKSKPTPDSKNHKFAKDGFIYRTAYFEDFDGKYYKVTISVGLNGNVSTVYNVGQIKKDTMPYGKIKTIYSGSKSNIMSNLSVSQDTPVVNTHSMQNSKNNARNSENNKKLSDRDYAYNALVSKPDMKVTSVSTANVPNNRADVVHQAKLNAAKIGKFNPKDASVSVFVDDIDKNVVLTSHGLAHGLRRSTNVATDINSIIALKSGEIISNSIRINEMTPSKQNVSSSYVLIGMAKDNGNLYLVRTIINSYSNEVDSMDVLYAINTKKESAVLNAPAITNNSLRITDSTISIAHLLDYVNRYFPDILPEDVLKHFGHTERPEGKIGESALFSDRNSKESGLDEEYSDLKEKIVNQEHLTSEAVRKLNNLKQSQEYQDFINKINDAPKEELDTIIEEYADWEQKSGFKSANEEYKKLNDEARKMRTRISEIEKQKHESLIEQIKTFSDEDVTKYVTKAVKKYHTTSILDRASYLLTTGSMLDFSEGQGYRVKDHREISEILELPDYAEYSDGLIAFMNMGNIRLQTYGIDISKAPTKNQVTALRDIISKVMRENDEFVVDFSTYKGYSAGSVTYPKGVSNYRIISDINGYFDTGVIPEYDAGVSQFRYSERGTYEGNRDPHYINNILNSFGITRLGDFIHVQRQVFKTLQNEGFFTDKDNRSREDVNKSSGMVIEINKSGIDETFDLDNYAKIGKTKKIKKLATIRRIPEAIRNGTMKVLDAKNQYDGPETNKRFAYIEYTLEENGTEITLQLDIKKSPQKNKFWVHKVAEIKNDSGSPASTENGTEAGQETTADIENIITQKNDLSSGFDEELFSDRNLELDSRTLLSNALATTAQNDIERKKIEEYQSKIHSINEEQRKLTELRAKIKELSFAKGPRDRVQIRNLRDEATKTANRINIFDKQLMRLEAATPLQNVLARETTLAKKKAEKKAKEALDAYRESVAQAQKELIDKYQTRIKKGIDGRRKTELRNKIKDKVKQLNKLLLNGDKEHHVPLFLQASTAKALSAINMDTVNAEKRLAKIREDIENSNNKEEIARLQGVYGGKTAD